MISVDGFISLIRDNQVLEHAQVRELDGPLRATYPDVRLLGMELIRRGWLTPYQVNQLALARARGLRLGSYVLVERLGTGGMGQVFKAVHLLMKRLVAIKLIRSDRPSSRRAGRRFRREIRMAAQLSHANIIQAFDAGLSGDTYFLVMEYVDGLNLQQVLGSRGGCLPLREVCDYIRQAANGLQYAHEQGLVHRDIKPSNLLLSSRDATIKILDLGLARPSWLEAGSADADPLTRAGRLLGSLDYLAPEQASDPHNVDIRADLYSLGCTFYHLLTGQVPFPTQAPLDKILKHLKEEPTPVESLRPTVPAQLAGIVRKLMAKRLKGRYQAPAELAKELKVFLRSPAGRQVEQEVRPVSGAAPSQNPTSAPNAPYPPSGTTNDLAAATRSGQDDVVATPPANESSWACEAAQTIGNPSNAEKA